MRSRLPSIHVLVAACVLAAAASPAFAGGPLANCNSGQPFLWPSGGSLIPFNPDQGDLGPLTHAQAIAAVQGAFSAWGAVPTSTAAYLAGAELPVDVDITNFGPFLNAPAPDGLSAIVFDDTGQIFDLLFGPGSGVLGFAGPEWGDPTTCTILEGLSFLNGPAFTNLTAAQDVMVHEFGHYSNLAHTVVNGQLFLAGDTSGPTPFNTFGPRPPIGSDVIETMYPFYFGPGSGTQTLHADDVAILSTLYPEPGFFSGSGSISGTLFRSNGTTKVTGVNVIARNVANPFFDAVSAISGDFTDSLNQADPFTGVYRVNGLTPGASYAVYVDQILAGGFSTPPVLLPGPEEFHNGAGETNNTTVPDDPSVFTAVASAAGVPTTGVNVIFNGFRPGDALPVGDDGFVDLSLPFPFSVCGREFESVFVNANGSLSFGAGQGDFTESVPEFLSGPPRIAGVWDDLNPAAGGIVTFDQTDHTFTVHWRDVPEFPAAGANSFSITLKRVGNLARVEYGALSALDGLAGLSCGIAATSGFENEESLRKRRDHRIVDMRFDTATFEIFTAGDNDLAGFDVTYFNFKRGFRDVFEPNDDVAHARRVHLPFRSASLLHFSELSAAGGDVDFYRFSVRAGDILALEVVRGGFDSTLGVFDADTGDLLVVDDDSGAGLLSRLLLQANVDLNLAVAVSAFPDLDFTGDGVGSGRYVLSLDTYRGQLVPAGDDTTFELPLDFTFQFQEQSWNSVFVNSNGNLSFGAGSTDFSETVPELLAGPPRIAPLWDDLDPRGGLIVAEPQPHGVAIHYVSVPEFFSDSPNYFTVRMFAPGIVLVDYGPTARSDSIVGVTQGAGAADPGETDLTGRLLPVFSARGTTYERFVVPEPFDLSLGFVLFLPFF